MENDVAIGDVICLLVSFTYHLQGEVCYTVKVLKYRKFSRKRYVCYGDKSERRTESGQP